MARKASDSKSGVKKEKVTPSSNSHPIRKQPNPKSATTSSIVDKDKSSTWSKPVPNYLRPTFSSRSESLKQLREDANHKLLRRRSFDRPPSIAHAQKSLISPDPKERLASRMAARSSSFSASRTPSTAKPVLESTSMSLKPKTCRHFPAAERTSSVSKNCGNNTASHSLKHRNSTHDVTQAIDLETKQESLVQEAEEITNVDTPEAERKEVEAENDTTQFNDGEDDEKVKNSEISYTVVEGQSVSQVEDTESELHQDHYEDENKHERGENQAHSSYNHIPEEGITEGNKIESGDEKKGEENVNEEVAPCEETVEEKNKKEDIEEGNYEGTEEIKSKEGRDQDVVEDSSSNLEEEINNNVHQEVSNNAVVQRRQAEQGKKESPTAYNDVIEETKNKLLDKRKNKVKALVGAFETVIDYETATGSNK